MIQHTFESASIHPSHSTSKYKQTEISRYKHTEADYFYLVFDYVERKSINLNDNNNNKHNSSIKMIEMQVSVPVLLKGKYIIQPTREDDEMKEKIFYC